MTSLLSFFAFAAKCIAVCPSSLTTSTRAPCLSNFSTVRIEPCAAAIINFVDFPSFSNFPSFPRTSIGAMAGATGPGALDEEEEEEDIPGSFLAVVREDR